ncbi:MAG TPA: ribbon-helix-helix domain-containing protein [Candidatus Agrococcus pullicola]|uniref:Ribbon-helix-helix domain-containing protein n=1 Tax=Candidatus Agrococcus pullicola TaxID=2838429 RepID=A0A9D2C9K1_9MICO|nr:ribbon-helix-helix domain-containing protein [Candidatus Agrococcus pullicola]
MYVTLDLPEDLMHRLEQRAREDGVTIDDVVEAALRQYLAKPAPNDERGQLPNAMSLGGVQPGIDLDDGSALQDLLDRDLPTEKLR